MYTYIHTDAEERVRAAEDDANKLKDENGRLRGEVRALESKVARLQSEPQREAVPQAHLGALEDLRTQVVIYR